MPTEFYAPEDDPERKPLVAVWAKRLGIAPHNESIAKSSFIRKLCALQYALDAEAWEGPQELKDAAHEMGAAVDVILGYLRRPRLLGYEDWEGWEYLSVEVK